MNKKVIQLSIVVSSVLFLANCDWFGSKKPAESKGSSTPSSTAAKGEVLLYVDGVPKITVPQFNDYVEKVMESQPQFRQLMAFMPDAEYELYKAMEAEVVLETWVAKNGIDKRADYEKDRTMGVELLDRQLAQKYFQQEYPIKISDAQVRKFYDEKKDEFRELALSPGGVNGKAVYFDNEEKAKEFFEKVKGSGSDFAKIAGEEKLTVKDLKGVNKESFDVDMELKDKLSEVKKFPSVEMIKAKKGVWVVKAQNKEEKKYVPFEQVKEGLMNHIKSQELFTKELDKLKAEYKLKENKEFFDRKKAEREAEMKKMMEQHEKENEGKGHKESKEHHKADKKHDSGMKGA